MSVNWGIWKPSDPHEIERYGAQGCLKPNLPVDGKGNVRFVFTLIDISNLDERSHSVNVSFWTELRWVPAVAAFISQTPPVKCIQQDDFNARATLTPSDCSRV
jgi:hypothetical protein